MGEKVIPIHNRSLRKSPRIFDVTVDEDSGRILRYDIQNIRGSTFVDADDMRKQIQEAIDSCHRI